MSDIGSYREGLFGDAYVGLRDLLIGACGHYERSAPTVARWADDLYRRMGTDPAGVPLAELWAVDRLYEDGRWTQPNIAANVVYKLFHRLGRDTTGMAGF